MLFQLVQQQLLCCLPELGTLLFTSPADTGLLARLTDGRNVSLNSSASVRVMTGGVPATRNGRALLESRSCSVKHKDGSDPMKQQSADPTEEAKQMRIVQHLPLLVPHSLDELNEPYRGICSAADHKPVTTPSARDNSKVELVHNADLQLIFCL